MPKINSVIKEFQFTFNELGVTKSDIEELLGFNGGVIPEPFPGLIEFALNEANAVCNIRGGFKIFDSAEVAVSSETIKIGNQVFNPSNIVKTQFKNAGSLALFIATAGAEISERAKNLTENGDPVSGYVFDVLGSVTVAKAAEKLLKMLETEMQVSGLTISDSFSPGYCEWSVAEQQKLFALMPVNFCGVTLSESSLMWPIKSVSGMTAIGINLEHKGYQCYWCTDKDCFYGKIRRQKKI